MDRLAKLDEEMKRLKADLTESKSAIKSCTEDLVRSKSKTKTYELMKTAKEHDIRRVIKLVREAETVDLAFLLDCTASMGPHIEGAKSCIKNVVNLVKRANDGLQLRVAVVGYRDVNYGAQLRPETLDFTSSVLEFEEFVSSLKSLAANGNDVPEDIAGAVQKACTLSWQQVSRVTFLITDAPCHGREYHSLKSENHPSGTPGICIEAELNQLKHQGGDIGMQFHFGRITHQTDKMIRVFGDKGIYFETCDIKDPKKLTSSVASSVRESISKSVAASKSKSKAGDLESLLGEDPATTKDYTIREAKPSADEWMLLAAFPVKVLRNKPISSVNDIKSPLKFGLVRIGAPASTATVELKMLMRRARDPFAEGEMRLAYYAKLGPDEATLMSEKADLILKSFKKTRKSSSDRKHYLGQMEVSTIAHFLAEEYNKSCRPTHCPKIRFLQVYVIETEDTEERFCAEDQLPCAATAFTKFSNNTGYWNDDEINQSLLLFTRFTFEKTGGYLMVTDLQGIRNGNEYILTDPAILCKDSTRFGDTNLGRKFIDKCMSATEAMLKEYGWDV